MFLSDWQTTVSLLIVALAAMWLMARLSGWGPSKKISGCDNCSSCGDESHGKSVTNGKPVLRTLLQIEDSVDQK